MARLIRVLVANRPKLMRELMLSTLADEPGVEIVGEVADEADIAERVRQVSPDLLVIALDEPTKRPELCDKLLHDHPGLRIIAVASQENCSVVYWASFDIHASEIEASEPRARLKLRSKGFSMRYEISRPWGQGNRSRN